MNGRRRVATRSSTINAAAAAVLLILAGCAAAGGPVQPPGLAYGEPDPNPVTYTFGDTASFEIQAPGYGVMEVETAHSGTAELRFLDGTEGYDVRVRFPELAGSFRSAGQGEERITAADIDGTVGVDLSPRGAVAVVDTPAVTAAFEEVLGVEALIRPLFVRLPGHAVSPGARWVDTVLTREESGGTTSTATSVVVSTLLGDTVVNGRRLLRIGTRTETSLGVVGSSGGAEIEQQLSGTVEGRVLWDPDARLLFARSESGQLSGTLVLTGTGSPAMPVSARVRRTVALRP
jgi:hypothetical protein